MRAIAVTCPHCGATLRVDDALASVTCAYCGTSARVQQRSRVLQVPRPPMPYPGPGAPVPVARQKVSRAVFLPVVIAAGAMGAGLYFSSAAQRKVEQAVQAATSAGKERMDWWAAAPVVADADGDGADDLIGLVRYVLDGDRAHLAAFSGKTGARIWQGPQVGTGSALTQTVLAPAGDLVLMATQDGVLRAYDRRDGAARWELPMGEKVEAMCAGPAPGEVAVRTADDAWSIVDAAGARRAGTKLVELAASGSKPNDAVARFRAIGPEGAPGVCLPIDNVGWQRPVGVLTIDHWSKLPAVPGMSVERLVRRPGGPIVAVGGKQPGTSVPMLARVDGTTVRWTAEIPATEPLTADAEDDEVGMSATAIYTVYSLANPTRPRLAAFDLETGKRLWDVELRHGIGSLNVVGVMAIDDTVVVAAWSVVQAFDQATGAPRYQIGTF